MKKLIAAFALMALLGSNAYANSSYEESADTDNQMTIKSVTWQPGIEFNGENKLLKAKVDFHYEGDLISLGYDYYFDVRCQVKPKRSKGGTKYLYDETRDLSILDELEIEGPKDLSVTFTFTLNPYEFSAAKQRGLTCDLSNATGKGGYGLVYTKFAEGIKTYGIRLKPRDTGWQLLK